MASFYYGDNQLGVVCDMCLHRLYTDRTGQEFPYHITKDARRQGWLHRRESRVCTWMDAMDYIEDAQTVDAQPVKRGKWECVNDDENVWMCTNCGNEISLEVGNPAEFEWLFCPHCSAYMGR